MKTTEQILYSYITDQIGTHENMHGKTIHEFRSLIPDSVVAVSVIAEKLRANNFEVLFFPRGQMEGFSKEQLTCVSFCEGDVYICKYKDLAELESSKADAVEFYKHN